MTATFRLAAAVTLAVVVFLVGPSPASAENPLLGYNQIEHGISSDLDGTGYAMCDHELKIGVPDHVPNPDGSYTVDGSVSMYEDFREPEVPYTGYCGNVVVTITLTYTDKFGQRTTKVSDEYGVVHVEDVALDETLVGFYEIDHPCEGCQYEHYMFLGPK